MIAREYDKRRRGLLRIARQRKRLDAYLITNSVDVSYLTGFTGEDSAVLIGGGWAVLITDFRFQEQAAAECPGTDIHVRSRGKTLEAAIAGIVQDRGARSVGVQQDHMTIGQQRILDRKLKRQRLVFIDNTLMDLRRIKNDQEILVTRKAVRIAENALRQLIAPGAKALVGKTERQLAAALEYNMRVAGADGPAFETIVAAGSNGSMCHYRPGDRRVKRNEAVLIDWGAEIDGYRSDMTRVVFTGKPSPTFREIYGVVLAAHDAAVDSIRPGLRCKSLDGKARDIITAAGYGEAFGHSLGHGIGRDIHENPHVSLISKETLRRNMIVTVEPGIYLPGVGGVRIEDDILVTATGHERLSRLTRKIERMILR